MATKRTGNVKKNIELHYAPWYSVLTLLKPKDFFVSVDNRIIWRRHLVWAKPSGEKLREHTTQRYASNMVFMSLVLSAECGVLFSPSDVCTSMRIALKAGVYDDLQFWIGMCLVLSMLFAFVTLITTFTAWAIVSSISDKNARCLLRSSIGLYATSMPSKSIVWALYFCASWMTLFVIDLVPKWWGVVVAIGFIIYFLHVISVFSALGKLIMYSGAMGRKRIFSEQHEIDMSPYELHNKLLGMAKIRRKQKGTLKEQYQARLESGVANSPPTYRINLSAVEEDDDENHGEVAQDHFKDVERAGSN